MLWPHQRGTCYWSTGHFGLYRDACIDRHGLCRHRGAKRGKVIVSNELSARRPQESNGRERGKGVF